MVQQGFRDLQDPVADLLVQLVAQVLLDPQDPAADLLVQQVILDPPVQVAPPALLEVLEAQLAQLV